MACIAFLGSLGSRRDFREKMTILSLHLHSTSLGLEAELQEKGARALSLFPSPMAHCSDTFH